MNVLAIERAQTFFYTSAGITGERGQRCLHKWVVDSVRCAYGFIWILLVLLAATTDNPEALDQVYNVAVSDRTNLNQLFDMIRALFAPRFPHLKNFKPSYRDFHAGDVRHSLADIAKTQRLLGYAPTHRINEGLREAMDWYVADLGGNLN